MKSFAKTTSSLVLIIVFLSACLISAFLIFAASWLHTYRAFTREKTVAELTISEQKEDELGTYVDIEITPVDTDKSALAKIFTGEDNPNPVKLETQKYKIYGDTVYIGGPVLKFKNGFILLNFETAYKLNTIFGLYVTDNELEKNRPDEAFSNFEIGSGDSAYREIAKDMRDKNFRGRLFKLFFDSEPQSKVTGVFISNKAVEGEIVIRNEGFHWVVKE